MTAVVLHALRYREDAIIVDIYTRRYGTLPFLVKVPRGRRPSVHTQLLRPLNILSISFDYRPRLSLQRLSEVRVAVPYQSLPYDPLKETVALFLSEFLHHALRHESANEALMEWLCASLQWLDLTDGSVANFHLVFLLHLSRHLGFAPQVEDYEPGSYFDLAEGSFIPDPSLRSAVVSPQEAAMLPILMRVSFPTMHLLQITQADRNRILEVMLYYYRLHVAEFPVLKSTEILHEVLAPIE